MANAMVHLAFSSFSSRSQGTAVLIDRLDRSYFHGSGNGAVTCSRLAEYSLKRFLSIDIAGSFETILD